MRYNKIRKMDIADGPGVRVSVFLQGCTFHCKNCFNKETWDFNGGEEFTDQTIEEILELCGKSHIAGLSILGGEPMHPKNIKGTIKLAKAFKEKYPNKDLWSWTGFLYENICDKEIFKYLDVLVDGQFDEEADAITDEVLASIGVDLGAQMPMAPTGRVAAPAQKAPSQRTKTNDAELEAMLSELGI